MGLHISQLRLTKPFISIFASGNSILQIPKEEIQEIKSKSFTVFMNYAPCNFSGKEMDALIWCDRKVSQWIDGYSRQKIKDHIWISREKAFFEHSNPLDVAKQVDYWYDVIGDGLGGNYTLAFAIQLFKKYGGNLPILLFGVDMYVEKNEEGKWYDKLIKWDFERRGSKYNVKEKVDQCAEHLKKYCNFENIYNCNLNSNLTLYEKRDWREILL